MPEGNARLKLLGTDDDESMYAAAAKMLLCSQKEGRPMLSVSCRSCDGKISDLKNVRLACPDPNVHAVLVAAVMDTFIEACGLTLEQGMEVLDRKLVWLRQGPSG